MINAITGINFDIQNAYIPSQVENSHFWGPSGALRTPYDTPLRGPGLSLIFFFIYCIPMINALTAIMSCTKNYIVMPPNVKNLL